MLISISAEWVMCSYFIHKYEKRRIAWVDKFKVFQVFFYPAFTKSQWNSLSKISICFTLLTVYLICQSELAILGTQESVKMEAMVFIIILLTALSMMHSAPQQTQGSQILTYGLKGISVLFERQFF